MGKKKTKWQTLCCLNLKPEATSISSHVIGLSFSKLIVEVCVPHFSCAYQTALAETSFSVNFVFPEV